MPNAHPRRRLAPAPLATLLLACVLGCASERPQSSEPVERHVLIAEFARGQVRLGCGMSCSGTWRASRESLRGLYRNGLWQDLAVAVARVGYASDLGYFYLGRAAEETGNPKAAEVYFKLALATATRCTGWLMDSCDGVSLPAEATAALARVTGK